MRLLGIFGKSRSDLEGAEKKYDEAIQRCGNLLNSINAEFVAQVERRELFFKMWDCEYPLPSAVGVFFLMADRVFCPCQLPVPMDGLLSESRLATNLILPVCSGRSFEWDLQQADEPLYLLDPPRSLRRALIRYLQKATLG